MCETGGQRSDTCPRGVTPVVMDVPYDATCHPPLTNTDEQTESLTSCNRAYLLVQHVEGVSFSSFCLSAFPFFKN